jgi:hypothetical protein
MFKRNDKNPTLVGPLEPFQVWKWPSFNKALQQNPYTLLRCTHFTLHVNSTLKYWQSDKHRPHWKSGFFCYWCISVSQNQNCNYTPRQQWRSYKILSHLTSLTYTYTHLQILLRNLTVIHNNIFLRSRTFMAKKGTKLLLDNLSHHNSIQQDI